MINMQTLLIKIKILVKIKKVKVNKTSCIKDKKFKKYSGKIGKK